MATTTKDREYTAHLKAFAATHRLKTQQGEEERFVAGRLGRITEFSLDRLKVVLTAPEGSGARWWQSQCRKAIAAGMVLDQDGDTEGSLVFDPADGAQSRVAIRLTGCRQKRIMSEEERSIRAERLDRALGRSNRRAGVALSA